MDKIIPTLGILGILTLLALVTAATPSRAEILNNDQYGSIELQDFSVIEAAADMFTPVGLRFSVSRGGPLHPGDQITIFYKGMHDRYATLLDYSPDPDRKVKPLVENELTRLTEGGVEREYKGTLGDTLGSEYVMLIISSLPLTDSRLEELAQAPNEIELSDEILAVAVNDFRVVQPFVTPDRSIGGPVSQPVPINNDMFIPLSDFATFINYPLNMYPYDPWRYMYLFPYARFQPTAYIQTLGPLTQTWYVFPTEDNQLRSNFWDYATSGWIDNGIWIIPPGGYWEGRLRVDDPYTPYYLRVLPFQWRENTSYQSLLQVEVNGTLVQPSIDITGAIGWGQYWTTNPFAYYNLNTLLHRGENQIRLYWPQEQTENLDLQMLDVAPVATVNDEIQQAQETAQTELGDQGTATDNGSGTDEQSGTNGQ